MSLSGLVVADDLTGATDTGHEFAARGRRTLVSVAHYTRDRRTLVSVARDTRDRRTRHSEPASPTNADPNTDVLVVDTDSRYATSEDAASAVRSVIEGIEGYHGSPAFVYKKVDSTLRGNLVAEVDAAVAATGADVALVAPASPRNGRTTVDGSHLVDGVLVAETPAGDDTDAPVTTSHLPTRFADSVNRVEHLPIARVAAGADAVRADLRSAARDGPSVVVADASHERHLEALARGAARADCSVVYVGSAGLARYVETPPPSADGPEPVPADRERSVLCVVGSTNPATRGQVDALPGESVVPLNVERAVVDPDAAAEVATEACARRLESPGLAALVSAPDADAPSRAIAAGRERGLDEGAVRERVATALGAAVDGLCRDAGDTAADAAPTAPAAAPEALFVTGGAVAADVLGTLDATGVRLSGEAVEEGIPLGRVAGGVAAGVPVVTKAGAFGSPGAIHNCAARLGGRNALE